MHKPFTILSVPLLAIFVAIFLTGRPLEAQTAGEFDDFNEFDEDGGWADNWLDGFSMHGRVQILPVYQGNYDFARDTDDHDEFVVQKTQLGFEKRFNGPFVARVTAQDSRLWGGEPGSDSGLGNANDNTNESFDMREGYLGMEKAGGWFSTRLGRQILAFGDNRLVGRADWGPSGRSFDAARFDVDAGLYTGTLFGAVLAEEDDGLQGNSTDVGRGNSSDFSFTCNSAGTSCQITSGTPNELDDAYLVGFYNTFRISEHLHADAYYFGRYKKYIQSSTPILNLPEATVTTEDRDRQRDNLHTVGARFTNTTAGKRKAVIPFDWTVEYAYQTGITGNRVDASWDWLGVTIPRVDANGIPEFDANGNLVTEKLYKEKERYESHAAAADAGYTLFDTVRIGGEYVFASGDKDRTDGTDSTFDPLFPSNHGHRGQADLQGWRNVVGHSLNLTFSFGEWGKLKLSYWEFDKHRYQDGWYSNSGSARSYTTESEANARYGDVTDASGTTSLAASKLRSHLFREYDLHYEITYADIFFEVGYSLIHAGDSVAAVRDDEFSLPGARRPNFDPRADRMFMMFVYKF